MDILVTGPLNEAHKVALQSFGDVYVYDGTALINEPDFVAAIADKDIYVCNGFERATEAVINAAQSLKLIIFRGVDATEYIDISAATARQITVCNAPGANTQSVAEFTIALLLSAWKAIPFLHENVRLGKWVGNTSTNLSGKRLGIIGMGRIGSKVAQIAHAGFGMQIDYFSRTRKPELEQAIGAEHRSLPDLLRMADAITLHVPSRAQSDKTHFLTQRELIQMKVGSVLINSARASLVEPAGLFSVLSAGSPIRCAAFDSFYKEGNDINNAAEGHLLRLPSSRFIVTPHVAWCTPETIQATFDVVIDTINRFLAHAPHPNALNLT